MKHLFSPHLMKWFWIVTIVLVVIKFVWFLIAEILLPPTGVNYTPQKNIKALYYRVKLTQNRVAPPKVKKTKPQIVSKIKDITLLAIYDDERMSVVTVAYKKKTKVLSSGERINGFRLQSAGADYALFEKNGKTYTLSLLKKSNSKSYIGKRPHQRKKTTTKAHPTGEVVDAGDHKIVDKSLITHYAQNMDAIYKNIGIKETKKSGDKQAFSVSYIKKNSPFAQLGLEKGDVIKSVNGQSIDSYNAAFALYKEIGTVENVTLVIQRGKEEMELEYEVN